MKKSRKLLIAGNWKMNKLRADTEAFFDEFVPKLSALPHKDTIDVLFSCPLPLIATAQTKSKNTVTIASQNYHWEPKGAFTGEVSIPMLVDFGVNTSVVGHSERRQYFNESNETMRKKLLAAQNAKFKVIACVGETLEQRKSNQTTQVIDEQLKAIISGIKESSSQSLEHVVIAYEPVWAIGTGLSATTEQAVEVHKHIRSVWATAFGPGEAQKLRVLYGGSVTPDNATALLSQEDIDGALIGGASLKPDDFFKICQIAAS
jgi:triosephosphate isomerase